MLTVDGRLDKMEQFFEKYKKAIYIFIAFLFVINIFVWKEIWCIYRGSNLQVSFLNVGQGDSAFVVTPQKHQILIDGGPDSTVVGKIAKQMPFWDRRLDLVILSHPEKDHMQGLLEILKRYKADYIVWSGIKKSDPEYLEWLNVLVRQKNAGAKIITAVSGQEIKAGNLKIEILNPAENLFGKEVGSSSNDTSVVAKLIYGKNSFLFAGDIDAKAEAELVKKENLKSDVLKVAHHGSKYSSSDVFLQAVVPKFAVIEVGKNTFGHPTPEAISRLQNVGAQIFRTDQSGDMVFSSDGQNLFLVR